MKRTFSLIVFLLFYWQGNAQKLPAGVIYWSASRVLNTGDFQVVPDNSEKIPGDNLAITRTGITYSLTQKPQQKIFEIRLYATVHCSNSYIRNRVMEAPVKSINYLLRHEQKHFDISEIFAREATKQLSQKRFTKNYTKEVAALMQSVFRQSEAWQDLYDKETRNGSDAKAQKLWDKRIAERLAALDAYKLKRLVRSF